MMRDIVSRFCKADKLVSWETECLHSVKWTNSYHGRQSVYILQSGQTHIMRDIVSTFCKADKLVSWETECLYSAKRTNPYDERHSV